ncbi:MAG: BREX-1 system adenine-specific DNA-methyltransferase PglX, partial [Endomicrobia bacterium]|nr:BREX-1 system adenine-specific DNA-methyltransferase PglX [Endomicrobiia bacterium]
MSKNILQDIINNFELDKFETFFRAKNNRLSFPKEKLYYEDENFKDGMKLATGKLQDDTYFAVYSFKVLKNLTERSGKKAQYILGRKILKDHQEDAAIFIFYDQQGNFRFSLIYTNYLGKKRDWSNFKRYTYFVSKELTNRTFLSQIGDGNFTTLESIKEAFSVEPVTKQFYTEIQNWFFWAMDKVEFPDDEDKNREIRNAKNLIRLITRMIFIWFMKVKKLIPDTLFDKNFIDQLLNYKDKTGSTYYKAILQNLFFATLNTEMKKDNPQSRIFIEDAKKKGYISDGYLQQGYYRYSRFIKDKDLFLKQFENIPFLNGGLFDCLDKRIDNKEIRIDCFSDNPKNETRLKVPDELFFLQQEIEVDLTKYLSDEPNRKVRKKVRGLLEILKSYNFTIDENTPVDQDVALDPELLGKIFENLLAAYNPETKTTARKATGSYYTPREIVEYMVDEALVEYLKTKLSNNTLEFEQKLRSLFDYNQETNPFQDDIKTTENIIKAIETIKILDPACGSGAFPMGVLHKLVLALHKLDPENKYWLNSILEKTSLETKRSLENKPLDYIRKLGLIEHCIYGVDIQEIAVQISKLRFFISLLVEQQPDDTKPNRDIKALPNLETKFVAA